MYRYSVQLKGLHVKHVRNYKFTVRKSTAKNTTNASAARAIVIIGAARKRAPTLSMTAATKTKRTRMLRPLILSSCRSMAARPTTRRTTNPTKAAPARIAINLAASTSGEIERLGPTKTSVNRGAVKDYLSNFPKNYTYAMPGSWISKDLRISRCALVTSVRI